MRNRFLDGGLSPLVLFAPEGDPPPSPPPPPPPPAPSLPPSKHDEPLPQTQATFDRAYVEELRAENKTWRGKMTVERTAREAADKRADDAAAAATAAKEAADKEAATKITEADTRANDRVIRAELKAVAVAAGMIDLDGLKLADTSKVTLDADGTVKGADELMTQLKEAKPYLFGAPGPKGSSNPLPPPKPGDPGQKMAKDMTPEERKAFLKEHNKEFG